MASVRRLYAECLLDQRLKLLPTSLASLQYKEIRAQLDADPNNLKARREYAREQAYALMTSAIITSLALIPVLLAADATGSGVAYHLTYGVFLFNGACHTLLLAAAAWRGSKHATLQPPDAAVRQELAMILLAVLAAAVLALLAPPP